jgi:hypothetical protein
MSTDRTAMSSVIVPGLRHSGGSRRSGSPHRLNVDLRRACRSTERRSHPSRPRCSRQLRLQSLDHRWAIRNPPYLGSPRSTPDRSWAVHVLSRWDTAWAGGTEPTGKTGEERAGIGRLAADAGGIEREREAGGVRMERRTTTSLRPDDELGASVSEWRITGYAYCSNWNEWRPAVQ